MAKKKIRLKDTTPNAQHIGEKESNLSQLLAGINKKNQHAEINFGLLIGKEKRYP